MVEPCSYYVIIIRTATVPLAMIGYFGNPTITIASLHSHTANTPHAASVAVLTTARTSPVIVKLFIYSSFSLHTKSVSIREIDLRSSSVTTRQIASTLALPSLLHRFVVKDKSYLLNLRDLRDKRLSVSIRANPWLKSQSSVFVNPSTYENASVRTNCRDSVPSLRDAIRPPVPHE